MSEFSRMKSMVGAHKELATIASATALLIPDVSNAYYVSGTTTVGTITVPQFIRNRKITLIGAASANITFTNNNSPSSAGQMYLRGSDRLLQEDIVLELFVKNDGTVILINFTG